MPTVKEILELSRRLTPAERQELARALARPERSGDLPLAPGPSPHSVAWVKAERGHAVLATDLTALEAQLPAGAAALAGAWADHPPAAGREAAPPPSPPPTAGPALIHTDVCVDLARGDAGALAFFQTPRVEIRLSTVTYLHLLAAARDAQELARVRRFASAYPVLSLGPMASSRAVELVQAHHLSDGLEPLDALLAATALAHELPLYARDPRPFQGIADLRVVTPC
jgi:predicted nucleic acid-binding protein